MAFQLQRPGYPPLRPPPPEPAINQLRRERASAAVRGRVIETMYLRGSRLGVALLVSHSGPAAVVVTNPFRRSQVSAFPIRFQKVRSAIPLSAAMVLPEKRSRLLPLRAPALKAAWRKPSRASPSPGRSSADAGGSNRERQLHGPGTRSRHRPDRSGLRPAALVSCGDTVPGAVS